MSGQRPTDKSSAAESCHAYEASPTGHLAAVRTTAERQEPVAHLPGVELIKPDEVTPPEISLEAYNALRANLTEAAKYSRNLFMTHLAVQSYALIVLAGLDDLKLFQPGNQQTLPIINASVGLSWFIPALAMLSFLVFVYWQMYHRKMWLLAEEASAAAIQHRGDPEFVPTDRSYRYPWIAFFVADEDRALRVGVAAFSIFQWVPMPLVQLVCCTRTFRLGGSLAHWADSGLPWGPFFGALYAASVIVVWRLWALQRRLTHRDPQPGSVGLLEAFSIYWASHATLTKYTRTLWPSILTVAWIGASWAVVSASVSHELELNYLRGRNRNFATLVAPDANLQYADLERADLERACLEDADLRGARLVGANLRGAVLCRAYLGDANLKGAILDDANLARATFESANLEAAMLTGADLQGANLERANLQHADLERARLTRADLRSTLLVDANLQDADLQGAHLEGANLSDACLKGANLRGAHFSANTTFPTNFDPNLHQMITADPRPVRL